MMKNEDTIEKMFNEFQPTFDDSEEFMAKLNRKIEAMEYVKQMQNQRIKKYKIAIVVAFVFGIICGGGMFGFMLMHPNMAFNISINGDSPLLMWINQYSRPIAMIVEASLLSIAIIGLVNMTMELLNYHEVKMRLSKSKGK